MTAMIFFCTIAIMTGLFIVILPKRNFWCECIIACCVAVSLVSLVYITVQIATGPIPLPESKKARK